MADPRVTAESSALQTPDVIREIIVESVRKGLDPLAVLSVAHAEGGLTPAPGVYDPDTHGAAGWSYGPFQMRSPGALPIESSGATGPGAAFAWSQQGIDYAVDQIATVAKGARGVTAIDRIVGRFEQPANPAGDLSRALPFYQTLAGIRPPIVDASGNVTPGGVSAVAAAGGSEGVSAVGGDLGTFKGAVTGGVIAEGSALATGAGQLAKPFTNWFDFVTSWRFAEIVGGFLLLIVGLILVGRSFGLSTPRTPLDRYADRMPTSREGTPRRTKSYTLEADRPAPKRPAASYDYGEVPF